jgi:RNase H-fold protein (predicted Holliday junction resolvase)
MHKLQGLHRSISVAGWVVGYPLTRDEQKPSSSFVDDFLRQLGHGASTDPAVTPVYLMDERFSTVHAFSHKRQFNSLPWIDKDAEAACIILQSFLIYQQNQSRAVG